MSEHATATTRLRAWVLAARLRTLTAAIAPVLVGVGLAVHHDAFALAPALAALVCALFIQVGTNFANDYFDHAKGADTPDRLGPTRVTASGLLDAASVKRAMVLTLAAAVVLGGYLVWVGGWPIVAIGLASVAAGVLYTGGPWPFGYHGLGDLFVMVFFGFVAVAGTVYVQALTWHADALVAGAGVGALATAILVVNNLRDMDTDERAGKRTLAVRMGPLGTKAEYVVLLALAAAVPVLGVAVFDWPLTALAGLAAFGAAVAPTRTVLTFEDARALNGTLAQTGMLLGLYGLLLTVGLSL